MARQNKRERRRLKRKAKKKQAIRMRNASPYRRFSDAGHVESCRINEDWYETGTAALFVLATVPGRPPAMASFLIDVWCAGLKDVWGRIQIDGQEFRDVIHGMEAGMDEAIVDCDLDLARELVAGSIRLAYENGFRLPDRYERWLSLLGGVGDWETADLRYFGVDGRYRWVGPLDELAKRLVGTSVEQFLQRRDVDFEIVEDPFAGGEAEGLDEELAAAEAVDRITAGVRSQMLDAARRWCYAHGESPHPRLEAVVDMSLEAVLQVPASGEDDDEDVEEAAETAADNLDTLFQFESAETTPELQAASDQFHRFIASFDSREAFEEAMGFPDVFEEDDDEPFDPPADDGPEEPPSPFRNRPA